MKCERSDWSDWSTSCGIAQRESSLVAVPATVKQYSCDGLAQKCEPDTKVEKRTTQCKFLTVEKPSILVLCSSFSISAPPFFSKSFIFISSLLETEEQ